MNFLTVSGVAATRRSPSAASLRTAIFDGMTYPERVLRAAQSR
jgi:hypothetical protein